MTVFEEVGSIGFGGTGVLAWSPDGRWLAIAAPDGLRVVDTLGGTGTRVVDTGLVEQISSVYFVSPRG